MDIKLNEEKLWEQFAHFDDITRKVAKEHVKETGNELTIAARSYADRRTEFHTGTLLAGINMKMIEKKGTSRRVKKKIGNYSIFIARVTTSASKPAPKRPGSRNINLSEATYENGALYGTYLEGAKRYKEKYQHLHPAYNDIEPAFKFRLLAKLEEAYQKELKK